MTTIHTKPVFQHYTQSCYDRRKALRRNDIETSTTVTFLHFKHYSVFMQFSLTAATCEIFQLHVKNKTKENEDNDLLSKRVTNSQRCF